MCTTIYGSIRDYRADMRNPYGPSRAHAICRHLIATAKQGTLWYGAHYWAACAATSHDGYLGNGLIQYRDRFFREATGGDREPTKGERALWDLAITRVMNLRSQAMALKTSVLW